jgi:predicted TIM-barrel fold metal-dependent hydrolase
MLFGTDFPYLRRDLAIRSKAQVNSSPELLTKEKEKVLGDNALDLFPRFKILYGL